MVTLPSSVFTCGWPTEDFEVPSPPDSKIFLRALSGMKLSDNLLDGQRNFRTIGLEVLRGSLHRIGEC